MTNDASGEFVELPAALIACATANQLPGARFSFKLAMVPVAVPADALISAVGTGAVRVYATGGFSEKNLKACDVIGSDFGVCDCKGRRIGDGSHVFP